MQCVLDDLPRAGRVAVIRLRSLGDCVLTTPALEILKKHRPDVRVGVVVEARFRAVFEGHPDVDEILAPALGDLRRFRPELCVNLHGGTRSAWLTMGSGASWRAGFGHFRHQLLYNLCIPRAQEILGVESTVHTAEHLASAMFWLGAPVCEVPRARLDSGSKTCVSGSKTCVIIHPVAATPEKTWRAEGFLAIAEHLRQTGMEPVFIGGAADDLSAFANYRVLRGVPLAEVKSLTASSALFVGNDSGPAHIAAAFGVPLVVIFGNSNPAIWGPWRTPSEVVTAPGGIAAVSVDQVLEALARLRVHA